MNMHIQSVYNPITDEIFIYLLLEKPTGERYYAKPIIIDFVPLANIPNPTMFPAMVLKGASERKHGLFEALCRAFTNAFHTRMSEKWKLEQGGISLSEKTIDDIHNAIEQRIISHKSADEEERSICR